MSRLQSRFVVWLLLALIVALVGGAAPLAANDAATEILQTKYGLAKLGDNLWVLPQEIELRGKLNELPKRRERLIAVEKDLDGVVQTNQQAWNESRPAAAVLKQSLARLSSADPQRELLERQLKALEASALEPRKLGSRGDVRLLVIDLASQRCELLAAIAWIRQAVPAIVDQYMTLSSDPDLAEALRRAGEGQRLGPQRTYKADLQQLGKYEKLAATPWVPTFQQGGHTRFTVLLDERAPATFTWTGDDEGPVVLTASTAQAIGLVLPDDAVREAVQAAPNRELAAARITIGYLRLGRCVLRGVRAYVLPPEGEDVGNRLGRSALAGHRVRLEPQRLRMWIDDEE
ncbi:MAG: retroviral-like aspartic protease family protein [Planctomycetaceae bacterium]|nr:retroviral-like aspartic protease family protein [Planctomycetaceae bacterium]